MTEIWSIVFGLSVLLAVAVLLQPVARWLRLPHTVLLAIFGGALGLLGLQLGLSTEVPDLHAGASAIDHAGTHQPMWRQMIGALTSLSVTAEVILFVFLPALVFESALSLDLRKLRKDLAVILFLAVAGVVISAVIAGFALSQYSGVALIACLLVGAIISATDPVAVIALFKELGAPKRLTILVEGESLFNDATAIVFATIFLGVLSANFTPSVADATVDFLRVFGLGIGVGIVVGWLFIRMMLPFRTNALSVVSFSLVQPFIAFVVAEHFLHVSGVMAAVVCGLALGSYGRKVIPPQIFDEIEHVWHQLAFWATALIFLLVGLAVPALVLEHFMEYLDEAVILFLVGTIARALIIFGFIPALSALRLTAPVSRGFQAIMVWGGLRGAVSLALALVVLSTDGLDQELKHFVGVTVTTFVLATLLFQATTISVLMRLLGLDKLAPVDNAMHARSLAWARRQVGDQIRAVAAAQGTLESAYQPLIERYDATAEEAEQKSDGTALSTEDWVRLGLEVTLGQERQFYLEAYGDGAISSARRRELLIRLEDAFDALRTARAEGDEFDRALDRATAYAPGFARGRWVHRHIGTTRPLAASIAVRVSVLSAMRAAMHRLKNETLPEISGLLPDAARTPFLAAIQNRHRRIDRAYAALARQYPDFTNAVEARNLTRIGFRLESLAYDRLAANGLISPEVFRTLMKSLTDKNERFALPKLVLRYDRRDLVARVPLFATLTASQRTKIANRLRPLLHAPGETILRTGDPGDSMYFIADGAVTVILTDGSAVELGTGAYFGEIALLSGAPRNADVVSDAYSTLLQLPKRDFERLLAQSPAIAREIQAVASSRS